MGFLRFIGVIDIYVQIETAVVKKSMQINGLRRVA